MFLGGGGGGGCGCVRGAWLRVKGYVSQGTKILKVTAARRNKMALWAMFLFQQACLLFPGINSERNSRYVMLGFQERFCTVQNGLLEVRYGPSRYQAKIFYEAVCFLFQI